MGRLLRGVEEGQSTPSRLHRSPGVTVLVVVVSVAEGGWLVWGGGGPEVGSLLAGVGVD
jgi:hypothetical protein